MICGIKTLILYVIYGILFKSIGIILMVVCEDKLKCARSSVGRAAPF